MKKLILNGIHKGLYLNNTACAYITYGTIDKPEDHKGSPIGAFYQSPFEFADHLNKKVIPIIRPDLEKEGYRVDTVDFVNQAPQPFVGICRKDNNEIKDTDVNTIKKIIDKKLMSINKANYTKKNFTSFFNKEHTKPKNKS